MKLKKFDQQIKAEYCWPQVALFGCLVTISLLSCSSHLEEESLYIYFWQCYFSSISAISRH